MRLKTALIGLSLIVGAAAAQAAPVVVSIPSTSLPGASFQLSVPTFNVSGQELTSVSLALSGTATGSGTVTRVGPANDPQSYTASLGATFTLAVDPSNVLTVSPSASFITPTLRRGGVAASGSLQDTRTAGPLTLTSATLLGMFSGPGSLLLGLVIDATSSISPLDKSKVSWNPTISAFGSLTVTYFSRSIVTDPGPGPGTPPGTGSGNGPGTGSGNGPGTDPVPVPEPVGITLFGTALLGFGLLRRRQRQNA